MLRVHLIDLREAPADPVAVVARKLVRAGAEHDDAAARPLRDVVAAGPE
jgi:hypothetical protein